MGVMARLALGMKRSLEEGSTFQLHGVHSGTSDYLAGAFEY